MQAGTVPHDAAPYRYAPAHRRIIEEQINEMIIEGIIVPSKSP